MKNNADSKIINKKVSNWKKLLVKLSHQFELGKKEVLDEFEEVKGRLKESIEDYIETLSTTQSIGNLNMKSTIAALEDLKIKAEEDKCETAKELKKRQEEMAANISEIRNNLAASLENIKEDKASLLKDMDQRLQFFDIEFETMKAQLLVSENIDLTKEKQVIESRINDFKSKLEEAEEVIHNKWDRYSSEMKTLLDDLHRLNNKS